MCRFASIFSVIFNITMKFEVKICLVVFVFNIPNSHSITKEWNKTAEILFNLTNYAIESRQNYNLCRFELNYIKYRSCIQYHHGSIQYPTLPSYPQSFYLRPHQHFPYPQERPVQNYQTIMDVLYSIAENDKLRCVPRLLCEVTSDTISTGRQSFTLPKLPFNVNMESIIGLLSVIDIASVSPIPTFAKAALLGYVSKGNSDSCLKAYPNCPRDPNKLVQYLNNYNGGFFRFFNGNPQRQLSQKYAQQRIQNTPVKYISNSNNRDVFFSSQKRPSKTLVFPNVKSDDNFNEFSLRKPKELPFPISGYYSDELDLQRPLPNHKATPMIFPDRTGTGDLRLDPEELNDNYKQFHYNLQNENLISFSALPTNEGFYYEMPEDNDNINTKININSPVFSFPVQ